MGFLSDLWKGVTTVVGGVVGFIIGGPVGAVIGAGLGYAGGAAVAEIVGMIFNPGFDVPDSDVNQNQGITINKQGTNNSIPVIYGQRYVGGSRVAVATSGSDNEFLYIVLAVAEGEINAFKEIHVNDRLAWSGTTTHGGQYEADQGKFKGYLTFQVFHGQDNQTTSSLARQIGAGWGDSHRLRGIAYIVARCKWFKIEKAEDQDLTPWQGGIPNITCVVQGRKVADATGFASTVTRATAYESETEVYTTNPVSCLLDYLRNPVYGKGLGNDRIDFGSFKTEAVRINTLDSGSPAPAELRQECNAIIFTDRTLMSNIKTFLFNTRAAMPYTQGRFKVSLNDNRDDTSRYGPTSTAVMQFDPTNMIGTVTINAETTQTKYNRVIVTYMGGGREDLTTNEPIEYQWPEAGSALEATFLEEDNDRVNEHRITLEHVTQDAIAKKIAQVLLNKSRYRSKTVGFTTDARAQALEINDIVQIYYEGFGIDGKFRIASIAMNNDYTFTIVAEEHNDLMYSGNPLEYVRKIHRVGTQGSTPAPLYYNYDVNGNPIYENPLNFNDLPGTPEERLEDIANGDYEIDQPVDIYVPEDRSIADPVLYSISVQVDSESDTGNTGIYRKLSFHLQPTTNTLVQSAQIYYSKNDPNNLAPTNFGAITVNGAEGLVTVDHVWFKVAGYYAVQYRGGGQQSRVSDSIYMSEVALSNLYSVSVTDNTSPSDPAVPIPTPDFVSVSFSGSPLTITLNYTPANDLRIRDVELYGSLYGTGPWLRLGRADYDNSGSVTLPWETLGYTSHPRSLYLKFDDGPGESALNMLYEPSNRIFVQTTDMTAGNTVDYTSSEPWVIEQTALDAPVITSIDIDNRLGGGFVVNFDVPTDERVADIRVYYTSNGSTEPGLLPGVSNLGTGEFAVGGAQGSSGPSWTDGAAGFYFARFTCIDANSANPNGPYQGPNSNMIYVAASDWENAPTTNITRDFKPAPLPLPVPVLTSVDVGTGSPNTITANFNISNDQRVYRADIQYSQNGIEAWTTSTGYTSVTAQAAPEAGTLTDTTGITSGSTSNGVLVRVVFLTTTGVESISNSIWVTKAQLAAPPVTGITTSVADPYDITTATNTFDYVRIADSGILRYAGATQNKTLMTLYYTDTFPEYAYNAKIFYTRSGVTTPQEVRIGVDAERALAQTGTATALVDPGFAINLFIRVYYSQGAPVTYKDTNIISLSTSDLVDYGAIKS